MKNIRFPLVCALALAVPTLFAQEEAAEKPATEQPADGDAAGIAPSQKQPPEKPFHMLPFCRLMEGGAEVLHPGKTTWEPLEEGRFYPLGCAYRTVSDKSRLTIQFGKLSEVRIEGLASFGTRVQEVGRQDRAILLRNGTIKVSLPRSMPAGLFRVSAPGFTVSDLAGDSEYAFEGTGDGDTANVRCVTGSMTIEGRHFKIPAMRVANELKIRTSQDMLFTGLYGISGDFVAQLDQGIVTVKDIEKGIETNENRKLEWHISPQTAVRIHRAVPKIGERMSVTVMTFDETDTLVNRCTFAEGRPEINTGEQGEKALAEKEEAAKRAMESADAVTTEAAPEETTSTEEKAEETTTEESTEE